MKVKIAFLLCFVFLLCGCAFGEDIRTKYAQVTLSDSKIFTDKELDDAVKTTKNYFVSIFPNCQLNEIKYDENYSVRKIPEWHLDYLDEDKVLLLKITFDGEVWEGHPETNDFRILGLTRSEHSNWSVVESGYF